MAYLKHFIELIVYQRSRKISKRILELTRGFPREEAYSLTDQVRRSSRSVGAQIAEAWGKRRYPKHFVSKLTDADAEQLETQHWLLIAEDAGYLSSNDRAKLSQDLKEIGRMLNGMISKADKFCTDASPDNLREELAEYVALTPDCPLTPDP